MNPKSLIPVLFCFIVFNISATEDQNLLSKLVSLEKTAGESTGRRRVDALNSLADVQRYIHPAPSIEYGQEALNLAIQLKYTRGKADALKMIGRAYGFASDFARARSYFDRSMKIYTQLGSMRGIADIWHDYAGVYFNDNRYDKALEFWQKEIEIWERLGDAQRTALSLNNIGEVYINLGKDEEAMKHLARSLELSRRMNHTRHIAMVLNNIGIVYGNSRKYAKALETMQKALAMNREIMHRRGVASSQMSIGRIHFELGDLEQALGCFYESLSISRKMNDKRPVSEACNEIARVFLQSRQLDHAPAYLDEGLENARLSRVYTLIRECLQLRIEYNIARGDYRKAFENQKTLSEVELRLNDRESQKSIEMLQMKFSMEERDKKIELMNRTQEIQTLKIKQEKTLRYAFAIGFILILAIFILLFQKYLYLFSFWKKQKYVGQYRLLEKIGEGSFGTLFKAHNIRNKSKIVALKILKEKLFHDDSGRKRFIREATIIDNLDHPHVVRIIERGESKQSIFIAMEYLEGVTLEEKIKKEGPLSFALCFHIMLQIAEVLDFIHKKEIIHRDLKPGNIMLTKQPGDPFCVKLLDFGISKMAFQMDLTETGHVYGTFRYMSPEQISNRKVTPASDIYSFGALFYESVTGVPVFFHSESISVEEKVRGEKPSEPVTLRPDLQPEISRLILKMLSKNPRLRPSIDEVVYAIRKELPDLEGKSAVSPLLISKKIPPVF